MTTEELIKAHCDKHERSGRAQFSIAGIRALLDRIASLEAALAEAQKGREAARQNFHTMQLAADALRKRAVAAEATLDPFADVGSGEGCEDYPDNTKATLVIGRMTDYSLTLGDFRRAAALSSSKQKDGDAPTNTAVTRADDEEQRIADISR